MVIHVAKGNWSFNYMNATAKAIHDFLRSLGCELSGDFKKTPMRAAKLWQQHLLKGEGADLSKLFGRGILSQTHDPVVLCNIDVHLVCPHHLTVAFGTCDVAYIPNDKICGLGVLSDLACLCTARLVLQEDATANIANALIQHLGAQAAGASITARHPCHNISRAHQAEVVTVAYRGHKQNKQTLQRLLQR
jgi:GTP cyclohydrolase IA